jgi:hypothetical protein
MSLCLNKCTCSLKTGGSESIAKFLPAFMYSKFTTLLEINLLVHIKRATQERERPASHPYSSPGDTTPMNYEKDPGKVSVIS